MVMLLDPKSNLFYRDDKSDLNIIREQSTYNSFFERCKGKVVLDCGANIGSFSNMCLRYKPKKIFAFEPEEGNIKMIKKQPFYQEADNFKLIEKAITDKGGTTRFYINEKRNQGCHSVVNIKGRNYVEVQTIGFDEIISKTNPDAAKIDIESAEYLIDFNSILTSNIKLIAIELHFDRAGTYEKAKKLKKLLIQNFEELTKPNQSLVSKDKFMKLALFIGVRD